MKKIYESPEVEIEKFTLTPSVFTDSTNPGWGEGGEDYGDIF